MEVDDQEELNTYRNEIMEFVRDFTQTDELQKEFCYKGGAPFVFISYGHSQRYRRKYKSPNRFKGRVES